MNELQVDGRAVPLLVVRNRRARRYLLRVRPDGKARVTIPRGGNVADAMAFVSRNTEWLKAQLERLASRPRTPAAWRVGTEIWVRGERVHITAEEEGAIGFVGLGGRHLTHDPSGFPSPPPDGVPARECRFAARGPQSRRSGRIVVGDQQLEVADVAANLRPVIERHLWRMAATELPKRVAELATLHGIEVTRVSVRNQRSRWGSCSRRGTISLNWRLIQTPERVRDYIILHELAHRRHMNHSRHFWREVERLCPNYQEAERWLKEHGRWLLRDVGVVG